MPAIHLARVAAATRTLSLRRDFPDGSFIAPQAQLFETAKDRRRQTEALFKQVVKFEQIDPFWSILGDS